MAIRDRLKKGFTLVELMIVVAIVGVLAVLAVYGVRKYIANAKTAEAKNSLGQIGKDAVTAFEGEHMDFNSMTKGTSTAILRQTCGSAAAAVPSDTTTIQGKKYQSAKLEWSPAADVNVGATGGSKGFPCLKFEMTAPQYYSYNYASTTPAGAGTEGEAITGTARGDLNGDTVLSTFIMNGKIQEGRLTVAPAIGETSPEE